MSYEYRDTLKEESKSRYFKKLKVAELNECPYRLPAGVWLDDPTKWPDIQYPDIYDYLINTPGQLLVSLQISLGHTILVTYLPCTSICVM